MEQKRAPDCSWVKLERWNALTPEEQNQFAPLCPDFVVELMSPSDSLPTTREKMVEYLKKWGAVRLVNQPQTATNRNLSPSARGRNLR